MWDIIGLSAVVILMLVALLVEFGWEPASPRWRRAWARLVGIVFGLFIIWMIILFGFIK